MKKMMFTLILMLTIATQGSAMSYEAARSEALFLTDKMAYELNLTDAQYEAAYQVNLDYLMSVSSHRDIYGNYWDRRNVTLGRILHAWQWEAYCAAAYFYRPLAWRSGRWHFNIYTRYPHRNHFYFNRHHGHASHHIAHRPQVDHHRPQVDHHRPHVDNRRHHDSHPSRHAGRRY